MKPPGRPISSKVPAGDLSINHVDWNQTWALFFYHQTWGFNTHIMFFECSLPTNKKCEPLKSWWTIWLDILDWAKACSDPGCNKKLLAIWPCTSCFFNRTCKHDFPLINTHHCPWRHTWPLHTVFSYYVMSPDLQTQTEDVHRRLCGRDGHAGRIRCIACIAWKKASGSWRPCRGQRYPLRPLFSCTVTSIFRGLGSGYKAIAGGVPTTGSLGLKQSL